MDDEIIKKIFESRYEKIEENIQEEYHKKIKQIKIEDNEERNNIKMSIISELYYKQGFKDGVNFIIKNMKKEMKKHKIIAQKPCKIRISII